jgi:hypothetical protein
MLAALVLGWSGYVRRPEWACVLYLYLDSTRTLDLEGRAPAFGFEVLTTDPHDPLTAIPERVDEILIACRRHAKILAGHDLAADLAGLADLAVARRLPGVDDLRQQWAARRVKQRARAVAIDTAHDLGPPPRTDLAFASEHAALTAATLITPHSAAPAATVRHALLCGLAVALIAAHATGKYTWRTPLDLDELVTDAAWDYLDHLAGQQGPVVP